MNVINSRVRFGSVHRTPQTQETGRTSRVRSDVLVGDELLHPLDLALVLGQGFVIQAALQQMLFAVVDLSAVLQLERTQSAQRPQENLHTGSEVSEMQEVSDGEQESH